MESRDYEQIGRIYCDIVELQKVARANDFYLVGGIDSEGEFYVSVYNKQNDTRFYSTAILTVKEDNFDAIRADINTVKGFIAGWAKAREIAAKAAAQPEVEFGPLEEVKPKEQEAA